MNGHLEGVPQPYPSGDNNDHHGYWDDTPSIIFNLFLWQEFFVLSVIFVMNCWGPRKRLVQVGMNIQIV